MEDAETTTEKNSDTNENAKTFNLTKKTEKANIWPNPVLSSARSAFDRFLSRTDSTEKSTEQMPTTDGDRGGKVKKKRKILLFVISIFQIFA